MGRVDDELGIDDGPTGSEIAGAVVIFVFQILTAIPFFILTVFFSMAADGCSEGQCNIVLAADAIYFAPAAALCALVVTIPLTIRSGIRGGSVIVPPMLGLFAVIFAGILGLLLNHLALPTP